MKGKELSKYLEFAPDDIDLVVMTKENYNQLKKKALLYDDLKKRIEKHLTKAEKCVML